MKTLILPALALILSAQTSFAAKTCFSGDLGMDSRVSVTVGQSKRAAFIITLHETQLTASEKQIVKKGNKISIVNQKIRGSSEGTSFVANVNAVAVYEPKTNSMTFSFDMGDYGGMENVQLQCD